MDCYLNEIWSLTPYLMNEQQDRVKNVSRVLQSSEEQFPSMYVLEEEQRKLSPTIEKHYFAFVSQVEQSDLFMKDCLRYLIQYNDKNYVEAHHISLILKPFANFYEKPQSYYNNHSFYELMAKIFQFTKGYELDKTIAGLKDNFTPSQVSIADFLITYYIRLNQIPQAFEIAYQTAEFLKSKDVPRGLVYFNIALSCLYLISLDIPQAQKALVEETEQQLPDSDTDSENKSEAPSFDPQRTTSLYFPLLEQLTTAYVLSDLYDKQARFRLFYEIKKVLISNKPDLMQLHIKSSFELSLKLHTLEMYIYSLKQRVKHHLMRYEFEQCIRIIDENLTYLCHLLSQQIGDTLVQVEELLSDIVQVFDEHYSDRSFLENLPKESKVWWQLYFPLMETPKKEAPVEEKDGSSSSESDSSFQSRNNKNNVAQSNLNLRLLPTPTEFQSCQLKFEGKTNTHIDCLVRLSKLYSKYSMKFDDILSTQKQILALKYICQLQNSNLIFMLTKYSKPPNQRYSFNSMGKINVVLEAIPHQEIKFFNEEYQALIREFHNEFKVYDLDRFELFLNEETLKWLFKRLQDRYERSLEQMMKSGQALTLSEKEFLLGQLHQCIHIFQRPLHASLLKLNHGLLVPEIIGYFDEIMTIIQASENSQRLALTIIKIIHSVAYSFRMMRLPLDRNENYYLQSMNARSAFPLREKMGQTHLNMIMGDRFGNPKLSELYCLCILTKELKAIVYTYNQTSRLPFSLGKDLALHLQYMTILSTYLLHEESLTYLNSLLLHNQQQALLYGTCGLVHYITQLKISLKQPYQKNALNTSFSQRLLVNLIQLYTDLRRFKVESLTVDRVLNKYTAVKVSTITQLRITIECIRLASMFEQLYDPDEGMLKQYYMLHKQIKLQEILSAYTEVPLSEKAQQINPYEQSSPESCEELLDRDYEICGLPMPMMMTGVAELFSLIHLLKTKNYQEFLESQYYFSLNLLKRICYHLRKNYYYQQSWKYMVLLVDVTQRYYLVVNMMELFQVNLANFKDDSLIRSSFSYNHVQRGFKILRIILEESILKVFCDASAMQNMDEPLDKSDFKPKIKVIFHGLDDLNIENPRQGDLDLEIVMQTGVDQFIRLRVQDNQLKLGYTHIEKLNLVTNVLMPLLVLCTDFWIQYVPKNFLEFQDMIIKKAAVQAPNLDKALIQQWLNIEKAHLKSVQESMISFIESLEFWLMKTEGALMRELTLYSANASNGKPLSAQFDNLGKYLNDQGLNVDYQLIASWEKKVHQSIKAQLDGYITPLKLITSRIKAFSLQLKKMPYSTG